MKTPAMWRPGTWRAHARSHTSAHSRAQAWRGVFALLLLWAVAGGGVRIASGQAPGGDSAPAVLPSAITATLAATECHQEAVTLKAAAAPVPSLDVALIMDITSSMAEELDEVRSEATNLVQRIQRLVPGARFAVASFADYEYVEHPDDMFDIFGNMVEFGESGDYPWRLDRSFTTDAAQVQTSVSRIEMLNGGDTPEPYLRALSEAAALDWNPAARKIVVLFGDAYPHDPDPGPDATMGTGDDLTQASVLDQVQARGISIFAIEAVGGADSAFYQAVAQETQGQWYALSDTAQAAQAIGDLVERDVAQLQQVTLQPSAGYTDWVTWQPQSFPSVQGGEQVEFDVRICLPASAARGDHHFDLAVLAAGARIGLVPVTIRTAVRWWSWLPWLAPLLLGLAPVLWLRRPRRPTRKATRAPDSGRSVPRPPRSGSFAVGETRSKERKGSEVTHGRENKPRR